MNHYSNIVAVQKGVFYLDIGFVVGPNLDHRRWCYCPIVWPLIFNDRIILIIIGLALDSFSQFELLLLDVDAFGQIMRFVFDVPLWEIDALNIIFDFMLGEYAKARQLINKNNSYVLPVGMKRFFSKSHHYCERNFECNDSEADN